MSNKEDLVPMALTKLKILIIDDHELFRIGLKATLLQIPFVRKVDEAGGHRDAIRMMNDYKYDFVFLDIQMPGGDGIDVARDIRLTNERVKIIVLSMHCNETYVMELFRQKINGYLLKDTDKEELQRAIERAVDGDTYYTPKAQEMLLKALVEKDRKASSISRSNPSTEISARELDVLKMLCEQYSNVEIGKKLNISEFTVKGHREKLMQKTGAKNAVGLALYAVKHSYYEV